MPPVDAACRSAMRLTRAIYDLTDHFPAEERSGLTATLRRAAASIPPKIADYHTLRDEADAHKSLAAALATLRELTAYLDVADRVRMTRRWHFRYPRRRARRAARDLCRLHEAAQASDPPALRKAA